MDREIGLAHGVKLIVRGISGGDSVENADVELIDAYGARWSATVLTLAQIQELMDSYRLTGESGGGQYFRVPDLIVLREPKLSALVAIIAEMVRTDNHRFELTPIEEL